MKGISWLEMIAQCRRHTYYLIAAYLIGANSIGEVIFESFCGVNGTLKQ